MKRLLLLIVRATGVLWLWRFFHRSDVLIVTVHGVMDDHDPSAWRPLRHRLPPGRLDEALRALTKQYAFVPLAAAVDMLAGRIPIKPYTAALTFDDGYRNHVTHALPILRKHGVPATVFVSTGFVGSRQPFWFDRLDFALQHADVHGRDVGAGRATVRLDARTRPHLERSFAALRHLAKSVERDDRDMCRELEQLAASLEAESGRSLRQIVDQDPWSAVLSADEIAGSAGAVSFGSHTVDHLRLHRLDRATTREQLQQSKRALEEWTGRPCRFFCYPDGGVNADAAAEVAECGYEAAVTTSRGRNKVGTDLMMLRRVDLPATGSAAELLADVSGLTDLLASAWSRVAAAIVRVRPGRSDLVDSPPMTPAARRG